MTKGGAEMKARMMVKWYVCLLLLFTVALVTNVAEAYWSPPLKIDEGKRARVPRILTEPNGNAIIQFFYPANPV